MSELINRVIIIKIKEKKFIMEKNLCEPSLLARLTLIASASNQKVVKSVKQKDSVLGTQE